MTFQIVTTGRTDVDDFFRLSDVFTAERLNHTPLLVFITTEQDTVQLVTPAGSCLRPAVVPGQHAGDGAVARGIAQ